MLPVTGPSNMFTYVFADALVQWLRRRPRSSALTPRTCSIPAASAVEYHSVGSAASVLEPAPGPRQARTRPAPARTRFFFSEVPWLQCDSIDLTGGAGQSQDLRTTLEIFGTVHGDLSRKSPKISPRDRPRVARARQAGALAAT